MEDLVATLFNGAYKGRKVLVTGHSGFKGSWLCMWLQLLGAKVYGLSLDPPSAPSHFELLDLDMESHTADIRDREAVLTTMQDVQPSIVFHLAAQPLVRESYDHPAETLATNVMGTANVFEACRAASSVRAIVNITSDKCYENREWPWGYRENDAMGGHDPYSASKGCAELVTAAWRRSFFKTQSPPVLLASARAGNVIGGGDWGKDRLVPDMARATAQGRTTEIRSPKSVRPWQHVLEPLAGYLLLGERLLDGDDACATGWNFGPSNGSFLTVRQVAESFLDIWPKAAFEIAADPDAPHEAGMLTLDSAKARALLGFTPVWDAETGIKKTVEWYRAFHEDNELLSKKQLESYIHDAKEMAAL